MLSEDRELGWAHVHRRMVPEGTYVEGGRLIDSEKVVQVALNSDDEIRNLQVALLYSLASTRMAQRMADDLPSEDPRTAVNANWFTVAQWAVLSVGRNLRTRDLPHRASELPQMVRRWLTPSIMNLRSADDRRVAAALSYGQVMVFASICRTLLDSRFADTRSLPTDAPQGPQDGEDRPAEVGPTAEADSYADGGVGEVADGVGGDSGTGTTVSDKGAAWLDHMAAIEEASERATREAEFARRDVILALAEQLVTEDELPILHRLKELGRDVERVEFYDDVLRALADAGGYQPELKQAFDLYERAAGWQDPPADAHPSERRRRPADLIFEANMRITAVEQVILDKAVTAVINHVPRHITEQTEGRLATFAERSLRVPRLIAQVNSSKRLSGMAAIAKDVWARVMTDQVLVVAFPTETIRLGRDISSRDWREPFYAPDLQVLSPAAEALFDQFDRSLGDGRGAGAGDWRRFDDRLNFAVNLLRSRQQEASLFWQPFTDEDVTRVWHGLYPSRVVDPFEQAVRSPSLAGDVADLNADSCEEMRGKPKWQPPPAYREERPT